MWILFRQLFDTIRQLFNPVSGHTDYDADGED